MVSSQTLQNFGQMFIMAFDGTYLPLEVAEFLRRFRIGGVILFADNYENPEQLSRLTTQLQEQCRDETPLFIATDHEGGRVQRFRTGFTELRPMADYGTGSPEETESVYRQIARELRAVGVNFDLAPVADLCASSSAGAIGNRSFGVHAQLVAQHVQAAITGLQSEAILACAKHFPGHGATTDDSHKMLPIVDFSFQEMNRSHMVPFAAAIQSSVKAIMTAHVIYRNAGDSENPASLSRFWLTDILRNLMHFDGLIITDAIEMTAITKQWSPSEAGYKALMAGADILIYYREEYQFEAFYELRRRLAAGELDTAAIECSLARIAKIKEQLA